MGPRIAVRNVTRGTMLAARARVAHTAWRRVVGLLRDHGLGEGDGLWIKPCNSIHSFAMKFVFDAVFLDRDLRVVHLMPEMKPWRVSPIKGTAKSVVELPAGVVARSGTEVGDQFEMLSVAATS